MPKRRKKRYKHAVIKNKKYYFYKIVWADILGDAGHNTPEEFDKMKLARPVNEGWLYSKDKNSIKLFASYDREDDGSFSFGDRTMIPRNWVKKIQKL